MNYVSKVGLDHICVKKSQKKFFLCDECNCMWYDEVEINDPEKCDSFMEYIVINGIKDAYEEIVLLDIKNTR